MDSFQDIRSAIGTIKTEVEEFAVQRRSRSARFGVRRFGKARTINQAAFGFLGRIYEEGSPLRVALAYEQATQWHNRHPMNLGV